MTADDLHKGHSRHTESNEHWQISYNEILRSPEAIYLYLKDDTDGEAVIRFTQEEWVEFLAIGQRYVKDGDT